MTLIGEGVQEFNHPMKRFHIHYLARFHPVGQRWSCADHFGNNKMFTLKHLGCAVARHL
jgi:hypothetical protein